MLKLVFLTEEFFSDYQSCSAICTKENRPYVCVRVVIDGVLWAIPMRSHIKHKHVIWTDKENQCGIDLSKAVAIGKEAYISKQRPHIRENEFEILKRINQYTLIQKLTQYMNEYKKAKAHLEIPRNQQLVAYSALQYFEEYL